MAKHHADLICAESSPALTSSHLEVRRDGKCVICDSYVLPRSLVPICGECNYGSFQGRCVICGGVGISDAFYCKEKDRWLAKIVNLGILKQTCSTNAKRMELRKDEIQSFCA